MTQHQYHHQGGGGGGEEAIRFYCGVNEKKWNYVEVTPGPYSCVAPVYGRSIRTKFVNRVNIPVDSRVILDSGAFSDGPGMRLSFEGALDRQLHHADKFGYSQQIEAIASYDLLIDEKWKQGVRYKARWTEQDAQDAVITTIRAASYLSHYSRPWKAILSAQGVSAQQYLWCAQAIVPLLQPGDIFGLGGWCITGKMPVRMMPVLQETMHLVIPFLGREGVKRVHIWGVVYPPALGELLFLCDQYGISLSTDSAGPTFKPCIGEWGYGTWRDPSYKRVSPRILGTYRIRHVSLTRSWLASFREREYRQYRCRCSPTHQLLLFGEGD